MKKLPKCESIKILLYYRKESEKERLCTLMTQKGPRKQREVVAETLGYICKDL